MQESVREDKQNLQQTDFHATGGIQNQNPSKRVALIQVVTGTRYL